MSRTLSAFVILVLLAPIARGGAVDSRAEAIEQAIRDADTPGVFVVAHRGHTLTEPENSLGAIRAAAKIGAHIVEIDVRTTADGHLVLMHDTTVDRTTNGEGRVDAMTLAELRELSLMHGVRPTGETVPTLAEAFEAARGLVLLNIDPKAVSFERAIEEARHAGVLDHCVFKQHWDRLSDHDVRMFADVADEAIFMPMVDSADEAAAATRGGPWVMLEVIIRSNEDAMWTNEFVETYHDAGVRLWINPLWNGRIAAGLGDELAARDGTPVYGMLADRGYTVIQTDLPERAMVQIEAFEHESETSVVPTP